MMNDPHYNPAIPDHVPAALVHDYNVYDYQDQDPFLAAHALMKAGMPDIFWSRHNGGHWIVTGAEGILQTDRDNDHFSTKRMFVPEQLNPETPFFLPNQTDLPEHTIEKGVIVPLFAPNRIQALSQDIREIANELIDPVLERGECEFIADFSSKLPVIIFLSLVDLPREDREKLIGIAHRVLDPKNEQVRMSGLADLVGYLTPIIDDRAENPKDDVISKIVHDGIHDKQLSRDTIVKLSCTVLMGGLDTVTASLTYLARHLAMSPGDRQRLVEEPGMIPRAIEEVLRRYPVSNLARQFTRDMEYRGVRVKKNDRIVWSAAMSNLDERKFPDALTVDFDRKRQQSASFGQGIHFCPGATLARTELRIFAEVWLSRVPDFHIRPGADIRYRDGHTITLDNLPLVIGKG
ncbi:MAG: cytochrome P450 [Sphingobium sp.]